MTVERVGVKIAVIGGGTGSFTLLRTLKHYTRHISALVNMADDGGSTGQLRDELGTLPPGDVRQCLVALSESERVRDLFTYRFEDGAMKGHAFGNLFLSALEKMTGSFAEAVDTASHVLNIIGKVYPITLDKVTLVMTQSDGSVTRGEFNIGHLDFGDSKRPDLSLEPSSSINPEAEKAILDSDIVVVAPGNLYGSLAPALVVPGVGEALRATNAKKVYVCNLVTKPGQTDGFKVDDFAAEIERFGNFKLDYVIYNNDRPPKELLDRYAKKDEYWVEFDERELKKMHYKADGASLVADELVSADSIASDTIAATRSLIRHNADIVARRLMRIYFS